ncbi:MAG: hypothetical protein V5A55_08175 [Halovenus sp.]
MPAIRVDLDVTDDVHIVALCGSQGDVNYTQLALEHVLQAAEVRGAPTDLVDSAGVLACPDTGIASVVHTVD